MDLLISSVNEADLGWKADICKYQKHHELYGKHCDSDQNTLTLAQIGDDEDDQTQELVDSKPEPKFGGDGADFQAALAKAQRYMKTYAHSDEIPESELPETYDYRNIDGFDFTSYQRDQGHCGSCYTISFTQVMEARLKLKYGTQPPMLSP